MTTFDDAAPTAAHTRAPLLAGRSVAVVHEWYSATGGAESVFVGIADLIPHAERYILWTDPGADTDGLDLRESWLAQTPLPRSKALSLPLMPLVWRTLRRNRYDVVISSSHAFAHTVRLGPPEETQHLSYVHSPARYVWNPSLDGRGSGRLLNVPRRILQSVDVRLSSHVQAYAANSLEVQRRIKRYWKRDAVVINPPVDVGYFTAAPAAQRQQPRDYLLGIGRWVPYKRFDLMIEIAQAARMPLVIAGLGPQEAALRRAAAKVDVPVVFELRPSRERLRELYWGARALLFPGQEDFGIVPVEAQACRTPVLGLRRGGVLETVVDGESGFLVESTEPSAYAAALRHVPELSAEAIQRSAGRFSTERFLTSAAKWIDRETR